MASLWERIPIFDLWHGGRELGYVMDHGAGFGFRAYVWKAGRAAVVIDSIHKTKEAAARAILEKLGLSEDLLFDEQIQVEHVR